ncbi:VOC family protein [Sphingomonas sp. PsM26]|nr:VOC family protein [Sphingomonas sp. PsM26]
MIDHVILTVSSFERSVPFYEQALKPLGLTDVTDFPAQEGHPQLKGFGTNGSWFLWLKEGAAQPDAVHVGLVASSQDKVRAFHAAAVAAGAGVRTAPGPQLQYFPGYFATWILDPDGHDIEVVNKTGQVE